MSTKGKMGNQGKRSLFGLFKELGVTDRAERLYVISALIQREISSFNDITQEEWLDLRDKAWPEWQSSFMGGHDWTVGHGFRFRFAQLRHGYQTERGQQELPLEVE